MREDKRILLENIVPLLAAYDEHKYRSPKNNFDIIWHGFKKACARNNAPMTRQTVRTIEKRGWLSPKQARMFYQYAGIGYPE